MRALLLFLLLAAPARAEELSVVLAGAYHDPVYAYRVGSDYFLDARVAGALYGGQTYWYPVSGRIQMSFHGRAVQLLVDSAKVNAGGRALTMASKVLLRGSQAYVPLAFLLSKDFAEISGIDGEFDAGTKLLTLERRSSVGPVRWFSYGDATRVTVRLGPKVPYSAAARGVSGVELAFPYGVIEGAEETSVGDDRVASYALRQTAKAAKLSLKLSSTDVRWRVKELSNPRRVALDAYRGDAPEIPADALPSDAVVSATPVLVSTAAAVPAATTAPVAVAAGTLADSASRQVRRKIVVDAGHGGKDSGAIGRRGTKEKDINLAAALELAGLLEEDGTFDVLLTRKDDTFVPLADRSRMANDFGADLFVSLHCNASRHTKDSGFEVYFMSEKATDPEAQRLAELENSVVELEGKTVQDVQAELILGELTKTENINAASELAALTARAITPRVDVDNRGVKQAGFYVLRGTHAPAILFEMAYVSNKKDEVKLGSRRFRRRLVEGLYAGVLDYGKRQGWLGGPVSKR